MVGVKTWLLIKSVSQPTQPDIDFCFPPNNYQGPPREIRMQDPRPQTMAASLWGCSRLRIPEENPVAIINVFTKDKYRRSRLDACLANCTSSFSLDRWIQTPQPCFPWPPKIISQLSVGLAAMIVFIDSDVPLGEKLLGVNGSWRQHRAGWWCPVTRPHTRVINWPPLQQNASAPLTVTWTKYNTLIQSFSSPGRTWRTAEDWGRGGRRQRFRFKWGLTLEINWNL